jgi:ADP-ribose pyrophosphatase YjhB (NUDIX family)
VPEPRVLVWLLLRQDEALLMACRKQEAPPFAGCWTLPGDRMTPEESSSETIERVARDMLDVRVSGEEFLATLYLQEEDVEHAVNVFAVEYSGRPRFRESGPFADVRWVSREDLPGPGLEALAALLRELPARTAATRPGAPGGIDDAAAHR